MNKTAPAVGAKRLKAAHSAGFQNRKTAILAQKSGVIEYYGYRDYDAQTGRWSARDPIAEQGGLNLYEFVENDGVGKKDTLGLAVTLFDEARHMTIETYDGVFQNEGATAEAGIAIPIFEPMVKTYKVYEGTPEEQIRPWPPFMSLQQSSSLGDRKKIIIAGTLRVKVRHIASIKMTLKHELHHVKILKKYWNLLANEINYLEREWCNRCAVKAKDYFDAAVILRVRFQADAENQEFDVNDYTNRGVPDIAINKLVNSYLGETIPGLHASIASYNAKMKDFYDSCLNQKAQASRKNQTFDFPKERNKIYDSEYFNKNNLNYIYE